MSKKLTITLYMSELIYDFQNKVFLAGRSKRANGLDDEAASVIQASDEEEDINQVVRSIQSAYGQLLVEVSEGLHTPTTGTSSNELLSKDSNIIINLEMPSNFAIGTKDAVSNSMHDYIIYKAISEWCLITNKPDEKDYADMAVLAMSNLHKVFNRRERPTRTNIG